MDEFQRISLGIKTKVMSEQRLQIVVPSMNKTDDSSKSIVVQQEIGTPGCGGVLAILDLPMGSVVNIDGTTIVLQRNDFVGIHSIPQTTVLSSSYNDAITKMNSMFHLVTVRGGNRSASINSSSRTTPPPVTQPTGGPSATTVGFLILWDDDNNNNKQNDHLPMIARRYDPYTEEVSATLPDDATVTNLVQQLQNKNNPMDPHRLISYWDIVSTTENRHYKSGESSSSSDSWYQSTNYITNEFLQFRDLTHGTKIVAGAYENIDDGSYCSNSINNNIDGNSIDYPPIPVFSSTTTTTTTTSNSNKATAKKSPTTVGRATIYRHLGTRRFLQSLNPSVRTSLHTGNTSDGNNTGSIVPNIVFEYVGANTYRNKWEYLLGDVQLSFVLFLHLHCFASWTYWRDVIAMLSFVDATCMQQHIELYDGLFQTLIVQLNSINDDEELWNEIDLSDDDCFLLPSLRQLILVANTVVAVPSTNLDSFTTSLSNLTTVVQSKFSPHFRLTDTTMDIEYDVVNSNHTNIVPMEKDQNHTHHTADFVRNNDDDTDDDDEPVIVSAEEIEESLLRSQEYTYELNRYHAPLPNSTASVDRRHDVDDREWIRQRYPLLLAAMDSTGNKEDIIMTCARILYDAVDVSLVREAAAYLENVEANKEC